MNSHYNVDNDSRVRFSFCVNSMITLVGRMSGNMSVANINKQASLLVLTQKGTNAAKITDYLNELCHQFIQRALNVSENKTRDNDTTSLRCVRIRL